ncbi:MAG: hypothetical protein ACD_76C00030G0001 [uncultured bacterium]|nr:MAG: hypothetical protein ACD_76C00030G0001 [uncultured bacterium]HBD05245.1 sodium:proton exchanger [Candidatus Uhrbacteria bacterium]
MQTDLLFFEIAALLIGVALVSLILHRFRQPLILAYMIAGVILGPSIFGITKSEDVFNTFAQVGVAFLLFTVGLNLNWRHIKEIGGIALATGVGQVLFTSAVGYFVGLALGFNEITSLFLSVSFAFSSTIVVVKLLSDKEDLDRLYGRISVGFLIVQDMIALILLLGINAIGAGGDVSHVVGLVMIRGIIVVLVLFALSAWLIPRAVAYAAASNELLLVFALGWCFAVASLLHLVGLGIEIGALVAGITLAGTSFSSEIASRVRPLRDFFLIVFFVMLGTMVDTSSIVNQILPVIAFSLFVIIGNPIIMMLIMRVLRYHHRTGFLSGTTMGQISEFSFIILASGVAYGYLDSSVISLATLVALITIAASAYVIKYNEQIFDLLLPFVRWINPVDSLKGTEEDASKHDVVLIGYHRMGQVIYPSLKKTYKKVLVVDLDPHVSERLHLLGIQSVYGDAGDEMFLDQISLLDSKIIISTIQDVTISLDILAFLMHRKYKGRIIVSAKTPEQAVRCYDYGASFVIVPSVLGGEKFADMLKFNTGKSSVWKQLGVKEKRRFFDLFKIDFSKKTRK